MEQSTFHFWLTVNVTESPQLWTMETGMSLYSVLPMDPVSRAPIAQISLGLELGVELGAGVGPVDGALLGNALGAKLGVALG